MLVLQSPQQNPYKYPRKIQLDAPALDIYSATAFTLCFYSILNGPWVMKGLYDIIQFYPIP